MKWLRGLPSIAGKQVIAVNPRHTSQECPKCGHTDKSNRDGEKFLCTKCGYVDHADTKASRTIGKRVGLVFPNKKTLPADGGKVTPKEAAETQQASSESRGKPGNHAYGRKTRVLIYLYGYPIYFPADSEIVKRYMAETLNESPSL